MQQYDIAKQMFIEGKSLRTIEKELGINRKKLSKMLKEDGISAQNNLEEKINEAIKMLKKGNNITNIASMLNIDRHTLSKKLEESDIRNATIRHKRNDKYDSDIIKMYSENISIENISDKLNISTNMVWNSLRANNIDTDKIYRTHSINENVFSVIDTEQKAYWLGFLYADGYVCNRGVELALKESDLNHIEKFKAFMESSHSIEYKSDTRAYKISIYSKKISEDLTKLGCFQNKSLSLKFPTEEQVPVNLIHHFMRGYFDGDGCVYLSKPVKGNGTKLQRCTQVLGTKEFLDAYMNYLYKLGINKTKYQMSGKAYGSNHGGNKQTQIIYDFLYKDATIYLDRKYNKFNCRLEPNTTEGSRGLERN